jgi:hypothetical protein
VKWLDAAGVRMAGYSGEKVCMAGHGGEEVEEAGMLEGIDKDGESEEAGRCMVAVYGMELEAGAGVCTGCKPVAEKEGADGRSMADTGKVGDRVQDPAEGNCVAAGV